MKSYGKVRGTERPKLVDVKETKVFVASNIELIEVSNSFEEDTHTEFEYDLVEYSKDEYIAKLHADLDFVAMMADIPLGGDE